MSAEQDVAALEYCSLCFAFPLDFPDLADLSEITFLCPGGDEQQVLFAGSVEERMLLLQEHKIMVAEKLLTDQQENGAECNRRDLEFLFRGILSA